MHTFSKPNRSSGLHIGGRPIEESESRQTVRGTVILPLWLTKPLYWVIRPRLAKAREKLVRLSTLVVPNI